MKTQVLTLETGTETEVNHSGSTISVKLKMMVTHP